MKMYSVLLLVIHISCATTLCAQETYTKSFGGNGNSEWQDDIKQMKDGGYLITGSTLDAEEGKYNAYCIKLDEEGEMLWSKTYNSLLLDIFTKCWGTLDGGFIMAFNSRTSQYRVKEDTLKGIFVVKCDSIGNVQWCKCIESPEVISYNTSVAPVNIYQSKRGDYYLLCDWFTGNDVPQFSLFKLNTTGKLMWKQTVYTQNRYHYRSKQILELDNGNIVVAENADGDEFYSNGNFIHLFSFSLQNGDIKQSIAINQYDNGKENYPGYIDVYNITAEHDKINVTGRYSKEGYYDNICWFSLKPNETKVKGNYIAEKGYPSFNYLINKNYITQPKGGFASNILFTKHGGYIYTYDGYGITVNKFDSIGRICLNYNTPAIDTIIHKTNFTVKSIPCFLVKHSVIVRDTFVIAKDVTAQQVVCSGTAPAAVKKQTHTNVIADTKSIINVQLYPNPATAILHITGLQDAAMLTIINTTGVTIKRTTVHTANMEIKVKELPAGTYYLQVQDNSGTVTKPFIKE